MDNDVPPSGDGEGEERPQGLSGGVGGRLGAEPATTVKSSPGSNQSDRLRMPLAFSPRICLPVGHGHSASGTAKFAPVRASREQVVGKRAQKGKKSQKQKHRYCGASVFEFIV